jgi:hypothetical protein
LIAYLILLVLICFPRATCFSANADQPAGIERAIALQGTINGTQLKPGDSSGSGLYLDRFFEPAGHPNCYRMVITLNNQSGKTFRPLPTDNIRIMLGPCI